MFSFRKKHKYTAYHDKHKDHTYTTNTAGDDWDDEETDSFLFENLADVPSDDALPNINHNNNNDNGDQVHSDDHTSSSKPGDKDWPPMWPKSNKARDRERNSSAPSSISTTADSSQRKPRYSSTANFPDPELDEEDDDQLERKQMKIENMRKQQQEEEAKFKQMIEEKKKALKKKNNFMSKIMNVFKKSKGNKKKKGKYGSPGDLDGEQCETPLTLTDDTYSDEDLRE